MKKSLVSLSLLFTVISISVTGIMLLLFPHQISTARIHQVFGIIFIVGAVLHLSNNFKSIQAYIKMPGNKQPFVRKRFIIITVIAILFLSVSFYGREPINSFYQWGSELRMAASNKEDAEQIKLQIIRKNINENGDKLMIEVFKGPYFIWPTYAIWAEDTLGNYLQTIYVTEKLAKNNFYVKVINENGVDKFISEPETKAERERPEALPVWSNKFGQVSSKGNIVPSGENLIPDAYTGATILNDFRLHTQTDSKIPQVFIIRMEVNQSFDWNDYYSKDRFPDDPVYSGNGKPGQPSLIYETVVDQQYHDHLFKLKLVGRGHHSGRDGQIYDDLENITTAKEIFERVLVELPQD